MIDFLYQTETRNKEARYKNLVEYRDEVIRGFVIYVQLALEDVLRELVLELIRQTSIYPKVRSSKEMLKWVDGKNLLEWCLMLEIINKKQFNQLQILNTVRNRCAHNWLISLPKYKKSTNKNGKVKKWKKEPLVRFHGKNLLNPGVLKDVFIPIYAPMYRRLFLKLLRAREYRDQSSKQR